MFLLSLCLLAGSAWAALPREILIGAYNFPPYMVHPERDTGSGLTVELVALFNQVQKRFHFSIVPTSSARRYRDLQTGRFDLILFEDPHWGWEGARYTLIDMGIDDAEVYVARAEPERGEDYFDTLLGKRLVLYAGYHYGFAGYDADPLMLQKRFQATLTYSHDSNLLMVLHDRADIAVVTRSYLEQMLQRDPELHGKLLVSRRFDQEYHLNAMLRPNAPIEPQDFEGLLQRLQADESYQRLLERYQLPFKKNDRD
ncbi:amino acid ABC transporter substrate-binding protein [Metapseudomonas otitidis]|uniref:Amino acid ABC transporter substrate-binding protein n=1 Tax=Metapseudomonas otitidis TaxID=319939 RepID=A0A679GMA2_9GAMM|nr:amino acid ABC transporter substrate-binding protein [Pseudomonas otitidis]